VAGDVATAGTAGPDVTQDLPTADDRVTSPAGMPAPPPPDQQAPEPEDAQGQADDQPEAGSRKPAARSSGGGKKSAARAAATAQLVSRSGATVAGIVVLLELGFLHGRDKLPGLPVRSLLEV